MKFTESEVSLLKLLRYLAKKQCFMRENSINNIDIMEKNYITVELSHIFYTLAGGGMNLSEYRFLRANTMRMTLYFLRDQFAIGNN